MELKSKLKYAALFAISFAVLTAIGFLAGLFLNIYFAPPPVAEALVELMNFTLIMTIAALILGFVQTFLALWLRLHHAKWFWIVNLIIAIILGGAGSFFSIWLIWALIALANLFLNFIMIRFLELRQLKHAHN